MFASPKHPLIVLKFWPKREFRTGPKLNHIWKSHDSWLTKKKSHILYIPESRAFVKKYHEPQSTLPLQIRAPFLVGLLNAVGKRIGKLEENAGKAVCSYFVVWQAMWKGLVRATVKVVFHVSLSSDNVLYAGAYRCPSLTKGRRDPSYPAQVCGCVSKGNLSTSAHLQLLPISSVPLIHNHITSDHLCPLLSV